MASIGYGYHGIQWHRGRSSGDCSQPSEDRPDPGLARSIGQASGVFGVDYREPLQPGNLTKYGVRGDKVIHQLVTSQFQRHSYLKSIKSTQT